MDTRQNQGLDTRRTLHDLNAALSVVIGNLDLLESAGDLSAAQSQSVRDALQASIEAAAMVAALQSQQER